MTLVFRLLGMLGLIMLVGCLKSSEKETLPSKEISMEEATLWGQKLEKTLREGDASFFLRAMDWSAWTDRILKEIPEKRAEGTYKRADLYQSLSLSGGIAKTVAEKVKNGGAYHFLRVLKGDTPKLLFRLIDPDGGVDYHELFLHRGKDGNICVEEIYLYHFGETFTNALRRTLFPELYVGGVNSYGVMMSEVVSILFRENIDLIQKMYTAFDQQQYQKVLDYYDALPQELQANKSLQILRLQAAQQIGDPAIYAFVLTDLRNQMKGDVCVDFLSLDYFFQQKQYPEALRCLERIDRILGSDPYLEVYRCHALLFMGKRQEARQRYEKALQEDSRLLHDPTFQAIGKALEQSFQG
ncbi:MAG: hypothetical protein Q4D62_05175 [Planctomycetia bacterium]|nr:hypothetical protein [Planctomycetia bacterium]